MDLTTILTGCVRCIRGGSVILFLWFGKPFDCFIIRCSLVITAKYLFEIRRLPSPFSVNMREHLGLIYHRGWIQWVSLFPWPFRSPALTGLDFFIVYQISPTTTYCQEQKLNSNCSNVHVWEASTIRWKMVYVYVFSVAKSNFMIYWIVQDQL